jgi:predicted nicotinamide N-methyase
MTAASAVDYSALIRANTIVASPPLLPEIRLHLASEIVPIWEATEQHLAKLGIEPPFWAFAWAGGQALARFILDHAELVRARSVLDVASGSGLIAIAAALAGGHAIANDIDPCALDAIGLNAALNGVRVATLGGNLLQTTEAPWQVILAGDVCYEAGLARDLMAWLRRLAADGALVLLGDAGRTYCPEHGLLPLTRYRVPTARELEDSDEKLCTVWRVLP